MSEVSAPEANVKPAEEFGVARPIPARAPVKRRLRWKLLKGLGILLCIFIGGTILIEAISKNEIQMTPGSRLADISKWNPSFWIGNYDEPLPSDFRPGDPHRMLRWRLRNPLHNFSFYIIGIADKEFTRAGRYPDTVFNPHDGWNWAVCKYGWLRLPFVSCQYGRFSTYFGWRERGNFGIKLRYHRATKPITDPLAPSSS